jgi:cell division protein FtsB
MPKIIMTKSRVQVPVRKTHDNKVSVYAIIAIPIVMNLLLIGFSVFIFYNISRSVDLARQKLEILKTAEIEVTQLRLDNIKLVMEKGEVTNPEYIEMQARNRLNYAKEGETQLVIPATVFDRYKNTAVLGTSNSQISAIESLDPLESLKRWADFFINGI